MKKITAFIIFSFFSFFSIGQCPGGLVGYLGIGEFNGSAYYISLNALQPLDAQIAAIQVNGHLAVINDQAENDFLQQYISEMTYIGLNDVQVEGNLEWENGESLTFNNIDPCDFCNENSEDLDYVVMAPWDGKWSFSSQWNLRKYIVEVPCTDSSPIVIECPDEIEFIIPYGAATTLTPVNFPNVTVTCPGGILYESFLGRHQPGVALSEGEYEFYFRAADACGNMENCSFPVKIVVGNPSTNGICPSDISGFTSLGEFGNSKYFISDENAKPVDAQALAETNGGNLVVINDQAENDFIQQNISEFVYIGLNDYASEDSLTWINGEPLSYNNINPCGFCNENSDDLDFVMMQPWDGGWSFSNFWNQRKYIIEIPCDGSTPSEGCAFGYEYSLTPNSVVKSIEIEETANGYELESRTLTTTETRTLDETGQLLNTQSVPSVYPSSLSDGDVVSQEGDYYFNVRIDSVDLTIKKFDFSDTLIWSKTYTSFFTEMPLPNVEIPTYSFVENGDNILFVFEGISEVGMIDSSGNLIWKKVFYLQSDASNAPTLYSKAIGKSLDGSFYMTTRILNHYTIFSKIDVNGNELWQSQIQTDNFDSKFLGESEDGSAVYISGDGYPNHSKGAVFKINAADGARVWRKDFPPGATSIHTRVENGFLTGDGNLLVSLNTLNWSYGTRYFYEYLKLDETDGQFIWRYFLPPVTDFYSAHLAAPTIDGGGIITVQTNNNFQALKFNADGLFVPSCNNAMSDLTIEGIRQYGVGFNAVLPGDSLHFMIDIANLSAGSVSGNISLGAYLSPDSVFNNNAIQTGSFDYSNFPFGMKIEVEHFHEVPDIPSGDYYLHLKIDANDEELESDESNNILNRTDIYFNNPIKYTILNNTGNDCNNTFAGYENLGFFGDSEFFLSEAVSSPEDAQLEAEAMGGHLVAIDDQAENDFLFSQINDLVYIGLNDATTEGTTIWTNGDPVNFTNFDICNFCNENTDDMDYVVMHQWNGGWSWSNLWNQRKYIVEIPCTQMLQSSNVNNLDLDISNNVQLHELVLENLYPNPTTNDIYLTLQSPLEQEIVVQIFDARGVLLKSANLNLVEGKNTKAFPIEDLSQGFYSILIPTTDGKHLTKRFVKIEK